MSSVDIPITLVYKKEVKYILNTLLRLIALQTLFNITTSNFYLQGYSGSIYYSDSQGEFVGIKEKILIIQPFSDLVKLETVRINYTDIRFVYTSADFNHDYLTTGYSYTRGKDMRKSLLKFDNLTSLVGKKIVKAYLRLAGKVRETGYTDAPKEVFVHRIEENYGKITKWIETPDYNPEPYASIIVGEYYEERFSWDITLLVKGWLDKTYPNYGLLLKQNDPVGIDSAKEFYGVQKPPYLSIIYLSC